MSSDKKIKFITQASSKGAGVDVTSDVISMPDNTTDHVLNVKADASCSGVVDVELEMSPDGTNWCPAVTRTVAVTTTAVEPQIGNEEYVKLTPDAGEFKNKHARGGLNFDVNGAVVTPDGTGARDLMHQHISVDKSFNYSQWFKTSEAPTTTYKPVLFRHGGYDNFSNTKAVALTDSATQNLAAPKLGNTLAIRSSSTGGSVVDYHIQGTTTSKNMFGDNNNMMPLSGEFTLSFYAYITAHYSSSSYDGEIQILGSSGGNHFKIYQRNNEIVFSVAGDGKYRDIAFSSAGGQNDYSLYTFVKRNSGQLPSQSNVDLYIDGVKIASNNFYSSGTMTTTQWDNQTTTETQLFAAASLINAQGLQGNKGTIQNTMDQIAFFSKALSDDATGGDTTSAGSSAHASSEVGQLWNSGNYSDLSQLPSTFNLQKYFKCGDGANDSKTSSLVKAYDIMGSGAYFISDATYNTPQSYWDYSATANPSSITLYEPVVLALQDNFTTTSNLSISGWFKTTADATGVLFSNTGGAAATGMKMEVNANDMTLSLLNASQSISVSSDVTDLIYIP